MVSYGSYAPRVTELGLWRGEVEGSAIVPIKVFFALQFFFLQSAFFKF